MPLSFGSDPPGHFRCRGAGARRSLAAVLAAATALLAPAAALGANYSGAGVADPAIAVSFKVKGKNFPLVKAFGVTGATYTCSDGQTYTSGFTLNEMELNDEGKFKFKGTQEFENNIGTLRISGKLKMKGELATGSFTESVTIKETGVTCTTGKQAWEAARA